MKKLLLVSLLSLAASRNLAAEGGVVAVAASLYPCVEELAALYRQEGGAAPELVAGSSGNLARQIEGGAPFALYLAADRRWIDYLSERGLIGEARDIASSPLLLWWPRPGEPRPEDLLGGGRVALADPEAAPFGQAARRYLEALGLWAELESSRRLVITGTVLQAGLAARSGAVDLAFVPASVARRLGAGSSLTLPVPRLRHAGAPVAGRMNPETRSFWVFLRSPEAAPVWEKWGFLPAEES